MKRPLSSLFFMVVFLAYNVWFIGFLNRCGFDLISQILIAYFTCSVLLFCLHVFLREKVKTKESKSLSLLGFTFLTFSQTSIDTFTNLYYEAMIFLAFMCCLSIAIMLVYAFSVRRDM